MLQTQLIAQLNQTIQELKEQLNKNSKNSSKPPSSDGFKKPAPKSLRKPSGKKAGGQNGHQGTHLAVITAPDKIVKHMAFRMWRMPTLSDMQGHCMHCGETPCYRCSCYSQCNGASGTGTSNLYAVRRYTQRCFPFWRKSSRTVWRKPSVISCCVEYRRCSQHQTHPWDSFRSI